MKQKGWKKGIYIVATIIVLISQIGLVQSFAETTPKSIGDDPGVTISGPVTISSRDQVELDVTLSASAGLLDEDGVIQIAIPSTIVVNRNDLVNNLVIDDPFYLADPAIIEDSGNYILNVAYDHTKLDPKEATGETFTIKSYFSYYITNYIMLLSRKGL